MIWHRFFKMIIYTGRFQPFHNGHLWLVHTLAKKYPEEIICLAVVKDVPITHEDAFDSVANFQLVSKRNPFNCKITLRLIEQVLKDEQLDNVVVTLLPRPSVETWTIINSLFDCERTWVFTHNNLVVDEWEEKKCAFFQERGERIKRIDIEKKIEGKDIRNAIAQKSSSKLKELLPGAVLQYIVQQISLHDEIMFGL